MHRRIWWVVLAGCLIAAAFCLAPGRHYVAPRTSKPFDQRPTNNAFVQAATNGDLHKLKVMLKSGVSPDTGNTGEEGVSALSAAAKSGNLEAVKLLLSHGADVNDDDFWGGNALVGASLEGHIDVVRFLLAHGCDPNMEDDGASALDYASHQLVAHTEKAPLGNYRVIVRMLKAAGGRSAMFGLFGG